MIGYREEKISYTSENTILVMENNVSRRCEMVGMHWHDYYELLYITSGSAQQIINGKVEHVKEGDIALIKPGSQHSTVATNDSGCSILVVLFFLPGINFENLMSMRSMYILPFVHAGADNYGYYSQIGRDNAEVMYIAHRIYEEYRLHLKGYETIIKGLLYQLLGHLIRERKFEPMTSVPSGQLRAIKNVCAYVEQHFSEEISLDKVAQIVGYTPVYLSRLFKKVVGRNYKAYCDYVRMSVADQLLCENMKSLQEIAEQVGYRNAAEFVRAYKRVKHCSPRRIREKNDLI